jgi:Pup amidohydrolase
VEWTLREWERVLRDLECDPGALEDRVDWAAKRRLLETYVEAEELTWEDEFLRSLDLEYHNVDPELGLYHALEQGGQMARLVTDDEIGRARTEPPSNTRAALRGALVSRFHEQIQRVSWGRMALTEGSGHRWLYLSPLVDPSRDGLLSKVHTAKTVEEAATALPSSGEEA